MKIWILAFFALSDLAAMASPLPLEFVGSGECTKTKIATDRDNAYVVGQSANEFRVKVGITLREKFLDEEIFYEFKTPVVVSLVRQNLQIVHSATGIECARYKKPGLIGSPMWVDSHRCQFSSKDRVEMRPDADGFAQSKICYRDYFMSVR